MSFIRNYDPTSPIIKIVHEILLLDFPTNMNAFILAEKLRRAKTSKTNLKFFIFQPCFINFKNGFCKKIVILVFLAKKNYCKFIDFYESVKQEKTII